MKPLTKTFKKNFYSYNRKGSRRPPLRRYGRPVRPIGSKAEVFHGTAFQTSGRKRREDIKKVGKRLVYKAASDASRRSKNLGKYQQPKNSGVFGVAQ